MKSIKYKDNEGNWQDLYSIYKPEPDSTPDPFNGHEYVDMGEAGLWAKYNIGAESETESGLYFAWGETIGYPELKGDHEFNWNNYKFSEEDSQGTTKYNVDDQLLVLEPEDDAAHINMGGSWRMPTKDEFKKLIELCDNEYVTSYKDSGIDGRLFKLKTDNTKQLFLPEVFGGYGYIGQYWSSTLYDQKAYGYYLNFSNGFIYLNNLARQQGCPIRAFIPKSE